MTSLAEERAEQQRWNARLREPVAKIYNSLLENEFEPPDKVRVRIGNSLRKVLDLAAREVPHYRDALRRAHADPMDGDPMDVLAALPILTKLDVQDAGRALLAEHLPPGEEALGWSQSSGTTAPPTRVLHTKRSMWMYGLLAQRASRWHRFDPAGKVAEMRIPSLLPSHPDGRMPASEAIENMPAALAHDLREFQIHQFTDNRMELRYVARSLLPEGFHERLRAEWTKATDSGRPELAIRRVDEVPRSPGGKSEVFTSDFMPARNEKAGPAA